MVALSMKLEVRICGRRVYLNNNFCFWLIFKISLSSVCVVVQILNRNDGDGRAKQNLAQMKISFSK